MVFWGEGTVPDEERVGWPVISWMAPKFLKFVCKSLSEWTQTKWGSRSSEHQRNCAENFNWRPWNAQSMWQNGPKGANQLTKAEVAWTVHRPVREARWYFGENNRRCWNLGLPV